MFIILYQLFDISLMIIFLLIFLLLLLFLKLKHTQKQLHDIEFQKKVFSKVQKNSSQLTCLFTIDRKYNIKYISANAQELLGYSQNLFISKKILYHELIIEEDRSIIYNTINNLTVQRNFYVVNYRVKSSTQKIIWILEQGYGIFDKKGKLIAVEAMFTDISYSKEMEQKMLESENKAKILIENSPIAICLISDLKINYCNSIFLKQFGYKNYKDVIDMSILDFVHYDYHQSFTKALNSLEANSQLQKEIEAIGIGKN
ncbi:MAG: PAS domain S-box protein [Bacteroidales bacterium]|nr:PAS domain S-box protein [Bacteroidales bacterium]